MRPRSDVAPAPRRMSGSTSWWTGASSLRRCCRLNSIPAAGAIAPGQDSAAAFEIHVIPQQSSRAHIPQSACPGCSSAICAVKTISARTAVVLTALAANGAGLRGARHLDVRFAGVRYARPAAKSPHWSASPLTIVRAETGTAAATFSVAGPRSTARGEHGGPQRGRRDPHLRALSASARTGQSQEVSPHCLHPRTGYHPQCDGQKLHSFEALMSNSRLTTKPPKPPAAAISAGHQVVAHKSTGGACLPHSHSLWTLSAPLPNIASTNNTVALPDDNQILMRQFHASKFHASNSFLTVSQDKGNGSESCPIQRVLQYYLRLGLYRQQVTAAVAADSDRHSKGFGKQLRVKHPRLGPAGQHASVFQHQHV